MRKTLGFIVLSHMLSSNCQSFVTIIIDIFYWRASLFNFAHAIQHYLYVILLSWHSEHSCCMLIDSLMLIVFTIVSFNTCLFCSSTCRPGLKSLPVKRLVILWVDSVTQLSVSMTLIAIQPILLYWWCGDLVVMMMRYSETAGYSIWTRGIGGRYFETLWSQLFIVMWA